MKTKEHTIKFILDNIKMSDKRVQRVITDVIRYFDDVSYGENPVVELLTGDKFMEMSAFNVEVLRSVAEKVTYWEDVIPESITITGVNNVGKLIYISWRRKDDDMLYESNVSFDYYNHYAKEYNAHIADDDADAATK